MHFSFSKLWGGSLNFPFSPTAESYGEDPSGLIWTSKSCELEPTRKLQLRGKSSEPCTTKVT